ncbi:hypothetical protein [Bacillus sp. FJAT-42315]|uniref:hypothetical protein n=1 Tax=Bacillus sp. FJAT-42315 TaxID=2014077 RepID=UPI000C23FC83|nr:hypothetical protein [Bacillus sp. FJAT-42315]
MGGVQNKITWTDSASNGTLTYTVKRNTTNSLTGATELATGISAGTGQYVDNAVIENQTYYYFVEVSNGTDVVSSQSVSVVTMWDLKYVANANYQSDDYRNFIYNAVTDSYELV